MSLAMFAEIQELKRRLTTLEAKLADLSPRAPQNGERSPDDKSARPTLTLNKDKVA